MKKSTVIDLTSLLDVILILLFVILLSSNEKVEESAAAAAEMSAQLNAAQISESDAQSQLAGLEAQLSAAALDLEQAQARVSALQQDVAMLRQYSGLLEQDQAVYQAYEEKVARVNLLYVKDAEGSRLLLTPERGQAVSMPLSGESRATTLAALAKTVDEQVTACGDGPVLLIFRYDNFSILRTEYNLIIDALTQVQLAKGERLMLTEVHVFE